MCVLASSLSLSFARAGGSIGTLRFSSARPGGCKLTLRNNLVVNSAYNNAGVVSPAFVLALLRPIAPTSPQDALRIVYNATVITF